MMSLVAMLASSVIRSTQALGLRGGPSLLRLLSGAGVGRNSIATVALPTGQRMCFPSLDPYWAPYLWGGRAYEPDVEAIFRRLASVPDKILVDCGANIGFWTVRLSAPEFGFSRLIAVEPNPRLTPLLTRNVALNGIDCTIVSKAIAEEAGQIVHLAGTEHHAVASVSDHGVPVHTTSLDSLVTPDEADGRMVVVKLDVEGSEIAAIAGARRLSAGDILFVYEDFPRSGFPVTAYLLDNGYRLAGIAPGAEAQEIASLEDARRFNRETHSTYGPSNLLACSPRSFGKIAHLLES